MIIKTCHDDVVIFNDNSDLKIFTSECEPFPPQYALVCTTDDPKPPMQPAWIILNLYHLVSDAEKSMKHVLYAYREGYPRCDFPLLESVIRLRELNEKAKDDAAKHNRLP